MLNELLRRRAIDVMDRIMSHPSTIPFHSMSPGDADSAMDLSSIRSRLQSNKYTRLLQWLNDVEQCWTNTERRIAQNPTDESPLELVLASANRQLFETEKRAIDILSAQNWGTEVVRLRGRITDLMFDPPPKIKHFAANFINGKMVKPATPPVSEHELHLFVQATEMLDTEEEGNEMLRIIDELQPDLQGAGQELYFDVSKLSARTLNALRTYVKAVLEKKGQKYPE
jgi:hypothetical protein